MKNAIYILNVEYLYDTIKFKEKWNVLEKLQQEKVMNYSKLNDRVRALGKYLLMKKVFELYEIENQEIAYGTYGKPYLKQVNLSEFKDENSVISDEMAQDFCFNISHSGDYVVCAVGNTSIGVDIQEWKPIKENIAKRFFSTEEMKQLNCCSPEKWESLFYRYWTAKESYVKFTGLGMRQGLDSFQVDLDNHLILDGVKKQEKIVIKEYFCLENYAITVCSSNPEFATFVRKIFYRL